MKEEYRISQFQFRLKISSQMRGLDRVALVTGGKEERILIAA